MGKASVGGKPQKRPGAFKAPKKKGLTIGEKSQEGNSDKNRGLTPDCSVRGDRRIKKKIAKNEFTILKKTNQLKPPRDRNPLSCPGVKPSRSDRKNGNTQVKVGNLVGSLSWGAGVKLVAGPTKTLCQRAVYNFGMKVESSIGLRQCK